MKHFSSDTACIGLTAMSCLLTASLLVGCTPKAAPSLVPSPPVSSSSAASLPPVSWSPLAADAQKKLDQAVRSLGHRVVKSRDGRPFNAHLTAKGSFVEAEYPVKGTVLLIDQFGKTILRFENFESTPGPDVHIYLASDLAASRFIDIGILRPTQGFVNVYPASPPDIRQYPYVLLWSKEFSALFAYAQLKTTGEAPL